jgi:hypothetical protein
MPDHKHLMRAYIQLANIHRIQGRKRQADHEEHMANKVARANSIPLPFPLAGDGVSGGQIIGEWVVQGTPPSAEPTTAPSTRPTTEAEWAPAALPVFPTPSPTAATAHPTNTPTGTLMDITRRMPVMAGKATDQECPSGKYQTFQLRSRNRKRGWGCTCCPSGYYQSSKGGNSCITCSRRNWLPPAAIASMVQGALLQAKLLPSPNKPTWQRCALARPHGSAASGPSVDPSCADGIMGTVVGRCGKACAGVCIVCPRGYYFSDIKNGNKLPCAECSGCGGDGGGHESEHEAVRQVRVGCGGESHGKCQYCPTGQYKAPFAAVGTCIFCPCGKYASGSVDLPCHLCPQGYYSTAMLVKASPNKREHADAAAATELDDDGAAMSMPSIIKTCPVESCRPCATDTWSSGLGSVGEGSCSSSAFYSHEAEVASRVMAPHEGQGQGQSSSTDEGKTRFKAVALALPPTLPPNLEPSAAPTDDSGMQSELTFEFPHAWDPTPPPSPAPPSVDLPTLPSFVESGTSNGLPAVAVAATLRMRRGSSLCSSMQTELTRKCVLNSADPYAPADVAWSTEQCVSCAVTEAFSEWESPFGNRSPVQRAEATRCWESHAKMRLQEECRQKGRELQRDGKGATR